MTDQHSRLGLEFVFLDFEIEYARHPREALHAAMALLLDEVACQARVELLETLAARRRQEFPDLPARPIGDFSDVLAFIDDPGLICAVEQGRVKPERLADLLGSPESLRKTHQILVGEGPDPIAPGTDVSASDTDPGFTHLASAGDWTEFKARLRPYLPALLAHVELDPQWADDLLDLIQTRLPTLGQRRFRECLPDWLDEFAAARGAAVGRLRTEDWETIIASIAVRTVLADVPHDEPEWARAFRVEAFKRSAFSWRELLLIEPPGRFAEVSAWRGFRRTLVGQAEKLQAELTRFFEVRDRN